MKLLGPCTITQAALPYIFENVPQSYHQRSMDIFERNATLCHKMLKDVPGICPVMPAGAMYMMVSMIERLSSKWLQDLVMHCVNHTRYMYLSRHSALILHCHACMRASWSHVHDGEYIQSKFEIRNTLGTAYSVVDLAVVFCWSRKWPALNYCICIWLSKFISHNCALHIIGDSWSGTLS